MKKMNKMYEAPVAEMIEMHTPVVLAVSAPPTGGSNVDNDDDDITGE
jgi:hypothetical protein